MNFTESIASGLSQYADFDGRSTREEFWYFQLFVFVAGLTGYAIDTLMGQGYIISIVITVALLLPTISIVARRLHDVGRSGHFAWLYLVPFGFLFVMAQTIRPGDAGPNAYGI